MNTEMMQEENLQLSEEKDVLTKAERVLEYFNEHPGVGFSVCTAVAAGGVMGMIGYGSKLLA